MMRRLRVFCTVAIISAGLAVSGCATTSSELDTRTSQEWRERVVAIAESADAGDVATALRDLDSLQTETTQARADGEITAERAAIIQQSLAAVRSDLEASVPEPVAPAPEQTVVTDPTNTETDSDPGGEGNGDKGQDDKGNGSKGKKKDDD